MPISTSAFCDPPSAFLPRLPAPPRYARRCTAHAFALADARGLKSDYPPAPALTFQPPRVRRRHQPPRYASAIAIVDLLDARRPPFLSMEGAPSPRLPARLPRAVSPARLRRRWLFQRLGRPLAAPIRSTPYGEEGAPRPALRPFPATADAAPSRSLGATRPQLRRPSPGATSSPATRDSSATRHHPLTRVFNVCLLCHIGLFKPDR